MQHLTRRLSAAMALVTGCALAQTHVIVNEIQYAPLAGEPEWVEIYNPTVQPVNVKNWKIRDLTATKKIITTKDALIAPGGYMVLTKDSTIANYHFTVPAPVITLSLPSLNNDSDAVILYDAAGVVVDSLIYHSTWGGSGGASLERIRFAMPSTSAANWRSSRDEEKSTPGRRNSVAPQPFDLALDSLEVVPQGGNTFSITALFHNEGEFAVDSMAVDFWIDANGDSVRGEGESFATIVLPTIAIGATSSVTAITPRLIRSRRVFVRIIGGSDGDTTNNTRSTALTVTHRRASVVINEIMYAPAAPEPEWIEAQNASPDTIDASAWRISTGTTSYPLDPTPLLAPGEYLVIARDTEALAARRPEVAPRLVYAALPTLSNTGGRILLRDDAGEMIDSVPFRPGWGGAAGMSVERVDSSAASDDSTNWQSCRDTSGATCARRNSRARGRHDVAIRSAQFTPDSTAIVATIYNAGLDDAPSIRIAAHVDSVARSEDDPGDEILSLSHGNEAQVTAAFSGAPLGDNLVTIDARFDGDEDTTNNAMQLPLPGTIPRGMLAVNEVMMAPHTGSSEYIEIVNAGIVPVNLFGCGLSGRPSQSTHKTDTVKFARTPVIVSPGGYVVIAGDSTVVSTYGDIPEPAAVLVQKKGAIALNNDSDLVVITDPRGAVIDSVWYSSKWHSPNVRSATGIALERINPRLPSNDRTSWASSVASTGGTPGAVNSVFTLLNVTTGQLSIPRGATLELSPNPFSPDGDGFEDFTMFRYQAPFEVSTITLNVFATSGQRARSIVNSGRAGHDGIIVWDGRDDNGAPLPMGMYVAVLTATDALAGSVARATAAVVVARKM